MSLAQQASILGFAVLVVLSVTHRGVLFAWNVIGVFWFSHVLFICIGLLLMPWFTDQLGSGALWPGIEFTLLSETDWAAAIALVVGWMFFVLISFQLWGAVFKNGMIRLRDHGLTNYSNPLSSSGLARNRLIALSILPVGYALGHVAFNLDVFLNGIIHGFIGGDPGAVLEARRASTDSYLFVQLVYNVIPFIAVALWLQFYPSHSSFMKGYTLIYVAVAALLLILVFQKRPLFIFLFAVGLAHLWMYRDLKTRSSPYARRSGEKLLPFLRGGIYLTALFGLLALLYLLQTQIGRTADSTWEAARDLSTVAAVRIFGRMAIQPVMVVHYFPGIEDFYGLRNIGLLTAALGIEHFAANAKVFQYFRGFEGGNIAMPALLDFYAAFGVPGWTAGAALVGFLLNRLDAGLRALRSDRARILATVFAFVFVYYLSQASLPRALMGYGGLVFLILWFSLSWKLIIPETKSRARLTITR